MLFDPDSASFLSSYGWVEGDGLWRYHVAGGRVETLPLGSGARHLSLRGAGAGRFAVAHHHDGRRFEVTVRGFDAPTHVAARATLDAETSRIEGDPAVWTDAPRLFAEYLHFEPWRDYVLIRLKPEAGEIEVQKLPWYDQRYDKDYQAVIGAVDLPGENLALVSVQRSSRLVLHDLATGEERGEIPTGGRAGNPEVQLRNQDQEIWTIDYDTLVVVRRSDRRVLRKTRLQGPGLTTTAEFVGNLSFAPDGALCSVARPFSGDVVGLDPATLKIVRVAKLGRQPLEHGLLSDGRVVARDWKTGDLLTGALERRRWFGR